MTIAVIAGPSGVVGQHDLATNGRFTFTGTASDDRSVASVEAQIVGVGDAPDPAGWSAAQLSGGDWSYDWYPKSLPAVPDGPLALHVRARDDGGEVGEATASFSADFVAPPIASYGTPPTTSKFQHVQLKYQSDVETTIRVVVDNMSNQPFVASTGSSGVASVGVMLLGDGAHVVSATAVDAEGNASEPLVLTVQKVAYTCLAAANGFPSALATVLRRTDDDDGNVLVEYDLGPAAADATHLRDSVPRYGEPALYTGYTILLRYASSLVPACATVSHATLGLYSAGPWQGFAVDVTARPVLKPWVRTEATYDVYAASAPWEAPRATGATDVGAVIATTTVPETNPVGWISFDVSSAAIAWHAGTLTKQGLAIHSSGMNSNYGVAGPAADANRPRIAFYLVEPP